MEALTRVSAREARYDGTDEITSESIDERCPDCNAQPNQLCVNSFTGRSTRIPHNGRTKRAERRRLGLDVEPPAIGS